MYCTKKETEGTLNILPLMATLQEVDNVGDVVQKLKSEWVSSKIGDGM